MNSEIHLKTWNAYQRAWGPVHETEREELLRSCVSDNILYTDPSSQSHGVQELMVRIAQSQQKFTGAYFRNDSFLEHHDQGLFLWTMYDKDGRAFVNGSSFGRFWRRWPTRSGNGLLRSTVEQDLSGLRVPP